MMLQDSVRRHFDSVAPKYITWEFYQKYTEIEPPFGQLGLVVFLRTYSRYINEEQRREKFCETVLRVVEYSLSLDTITPEVLKKEEAELLYDDLFNMRSLCAGRTLWVANTKITKKDPSANFNCTASTIKDLTSIVEGFYLLLVGAGFGFSVENKYIEKLPKFYRDKQIVHKPYSGWVKGVDTTLLNGDQLFFKTVIEQNDSSFFNEYCFGNLSKVVIKIGDSKEGWVTSLKSYLAALTSPTVKEIVFNYDYVRPEGELLKTFGGRSSGYKALQILFDDIYKVVQELTHDDGQQLNSAQVMDIVNAVGVAVVVGGVRRSSQLVLADQGDVLIRDAKKDLWSDDSLVDKRRTRVMSNNSLALYDNPGLDWFKDVIQSVKTTGEPGFISVGNANKKDPTRTRKVFNPCCEILLDDKGVCNLTEVYLTKHINPDNTINYNSLERSLRLATRMGSRITIVEMFHSQWDYVQKRDRLLGVSLSGVVDFFELVGIDSPEKEKEFYDWCKLVVHDEADTYHQKLGINKSLLKTTIKPSGTLSTLVGCGSGIHRSYAPYYYRRVRVSVNDPIARVLRDMGVPVSPENGQGDHLDDPNVNTWVFTFPIKGDTTLKAIDESAITQLERYRNAQVNYVDHNVSFTCSVDTDEWDGVADWLYENYDDFIGVSFLPKFDSTNSPYPQLPYEACDNEQYTELKKKVPTLLENDFLALLQTYEKMEDEYEILDEACASGSCPLR